ncbi:MAG: HDIG domain-containing metalloprotein [Chloroflexota bacterium]
MITYRVRNFAHTQIQKYTHFHSFFAIALIGYTVLLMVGLLSWNIPLGSQVQLEVGQVAPQDIVAPVKITYKSEWLTAQARDRAAQAVPDQYDSAEGRIRRQQISRAREVLEFITIVRKDPYATPELQTDYLLAIGDLGLSPEATLAILSMSSFEWNKALEEVPLALDRAMRGEIRENTIALARRSVPTLINPNLNESVTDVTAELVRRLIRANSIFNETRTGELRELARSEVMAVDAILEVDEVILRAGDIVASEDVEALTQVGLIQAEWDWWQFIRAAFFAIIVVSTASLVIYRLPENTLGQSLYMLTTSSNGSTTNATSPKPVKRFQRQHTKNLQSIALLVVCSSIWMIAAKFMILPHEWLPYLYPLAALSILVTVLVDFQVAIVVTIAFTLFIHQLDSSNPALISYMSVGPLLGIVILGRADRLSAFVWAGAAISLSNLLVYLTFEMPFAQTPMQTMLQNSLLVMLQGPLSASIALIGYLAFGNLFDVTTSLRLTELSRPTHPLLRQLMLKSSGTYHHSIIVANLAERAAEAIGADAFLVRVAAYYHDIGKTVRPYFFAENISPGESPHEKLDPLTSSQIIISHVTDGINLAKKYGLPARIQDFIREHHGSSVTKAFYYQALKRAEEEGKEGTVNEDDFRYAGPSPQSKETAIMLLADTCEAAVRAIRPTTREDLEKLIDKLVDERVDDGELNECDLTLRELEIIKDVFQQVLQGVHHPRVNYPEPVKRTETS